MVDLLSWAVGIVVILGGILIASRLYFKKFGPNTD
jgi:hypothetical protein